MLNLEKIYKRGHHWVGLKPEPDKYFGFVYSVVDIKNKLVYIGKKHYKSFKTDKKGITKVVESNWRFYCGSSTYLSNALKTTGKDYFLFIITQHGDSFKDLSNKEIVLQQNLKVLDSDIFYNRNIVGGTWKNYGRNNPMYGKRHTDQAKKIIGEASKTRGVSEETKLKMKKSSEQNMKVYKFTHRDGTTYIGRVRDFCNEFKDTKVWGVKELIRGKTYDKTCRSGYANVHSRYNWISAELLGIYKNIDKIKKENELDLQ